MYTEYRKLNNYRVFLYLNERKSLNRDNYIFSIKKLEEYCGVPIYTIQHLINLRRLMTDENYEKVAKVLEEKFGFNPKRRLAKEELEDKELYEIFKI